MKVNIISGPFISEKVLVKLTPREPDKDPVLIQVDNMDELSRKVKEVGPVEITTLGCEYLFKEDIH